MKTASANGDRRTLRIAGLAGIALDLAGSPSDDEPDIQAIAKTALKMAGGLTVVIAASGNAALDQVSPARPARFLLDVMMPGLDGAGTLRALRERNPPRSIPVIFMTAKAQPQGVAAFRQLGALDVVAEPFDPMRLSATIRAIWDQHYAKSTDPQPL